MSDQQLLDAIEALTDGVSSPGLALAWHDGEVALEAATLLRAAGWIAERDGQIAICRDRGCVIGLDLGGTKLRGAIGDASGRVLVEVDQPTDNDAPDSVIDQIIEMVRGLVARAGVRAESIAHIAVGVPGAVDPKGRVALSPNVSFGQQTHLADTLGKAFGVPVSVDNDGNLSAYGEFISGRGRGMPSLAFLTIGTGVGMGLIIDGHLLRGNAGGAGEIAFLPFGNDAFADAVKPGGAFEAAVGSEAIRQAYARLTGKHARVREIFDRAEAGDTQANLVVERLIHDIALGAGAVIALLDPGILVIGGGIGARPGVAEAIGALTARLVPTHCDVVPSALGDRAGVVGAVAYARHQARVQLVEARRTAHSQGAVA